MKILPEFQQLAYDLNHSGFSTAFVVFNDICYFSRFPLAAAKTAEAPSSAVVKLLQGLFQKKQDHSFFILRNRIWSTQPISPMERGMVKVVAKRISNLEPKNIGLKLNFEFHEIGPSNEIFYPIVKTTDPLTAAAQFKNENQIWSFINQQIAQIPRGSVLHDYHRPVAAALVDENYNLIAMNTNTSAVNKTLHAEVNLLQQYYQIYQRKLPEGSRLYVSHKPCKMCAAMICQMSPFPNRPIEVAFLHEENGCLSRNTELDKIRNKFI